MIRVLKDIENRRLLSDNYVGNLAYIYKDRPYIAPITYYFNETTNSIIGYSAEGHKTTAMRKNSNVCLSVSEVDTVNSWRSVLAQGTYIELNGSEAKAKLHEFSLGVKHLIINKEQRKLDFISQFSSKLSANDFPVVFVIEIKELTGRMRNYYKS